MLLQELRRLALDPVIAAQLPREGYAERRLRYIIHLDIRGNFVDLEDLAEGPKPPLSRGAVWQVPDVVRSVAVRPLLGVDKTAYVFGRTADPEEVDLDRVERCRVAFRTLIAECERDTGLPELEAVIRYLDQDEMPAGLDLAADKIGFGVGDVRLVTDMPEVAQWWAGHVRATQDAKQAFKGIRPAPCLICGETKAIATPWPVTIKNIPGGRDTGNFLATANASSMMSHGWETAENTPACFDCTTSVGKALNWLLRQPEHHLRTSATSTMVFWGRDNITPLLDNPDPERIRDLLRSPFTANPVDEDGEDEQFWACGLSSNAGRIVIHSWLDDSLETVRRNLRRWFAAQTICKADGSEPAPLSIRRLALATTRDGRDDKALHPRLVQSLMEAAIGGRPTPPWILSLAMQRVKSDQTNKIPHARAALLKLALAHSIPDDEKELFMIGLDETSHDPAYACGRLMAELEAIQRLALGKSQYQKSGSATVTDRFFAGASSAPALVLGPLLRNSHVHLVKLRREKRGAYVNLDRRLADILSVLPATGFPVILTLQEQARFSLGYYHQKAEDRRQAIARKAERLNAEADPTSETAKALAAAADDDLEIDEEELL